MVFEIAPAKELTGGPWYTDQEFDHDFVDALNNFIVQYVAKTDMANINMISDKIRVSGFTRVCITLISA